MNTKIYRLPIGRRWAISFTNYILSPIKLHLLPDFKALQYLSIQRFPKFLSYRKCDIFENWIAISIQSFSFVAWHGYKVFAFLVFHDGEIFYCKASIKCNCTICYLLAMKTNLSYLLNEYFVK